MLPLSRLSCLDKLLRERGWGEVNKKMFRFAKHQTEHLNPNVQPKFALPLPFIPPRLWRISTSSLTLYLTALHGSR